MDKDKAKELARYTELPDTYIDKIGIRAILRYTWADGKEQKRTHALTNEPYKIAEAYTRSEILADTVTELEEIGRLLHRYGDVYAHTRLEKFNPLTYRIKKIASLRDSIPDSLRLYGKPPEDWWGEVQAWAAATVFGQDNDVCTIEHKHPDGAEPDYIWKRPKWYLRYVRNVAKIIKEKFSLSGEVNMNLFNSLAAYAERKQISLIGIIDYEIANYLYENHGRSENTFSFRILFATGYGGPGLFLVQNRLDYDNYISNVIKYIEEKENLEFIRGASPVERGTFTKYETPTFTRIQVHPK